MTSLYFRLAGDNIRKNRRLYLPYLLSGACMVAVVYLLLHLQADPAILTMRGAEMVVALMQVGSYVMALFSTLFLLYTSSFLMKQRSRELGLYNVLGMNRRHILRVIFWETFSCAALSGALGLALGVLLSKASSLAMLRLLGAEGNAPFFVSPDKLAAIVLGFAAIYLLIFLRSALGLLRLRPVEMMRRSQAGEKPPRANAPLALLGIALLAAGYAVAVNVRTALDALTLFFYAVLLVIAGTELCFRSASVFLLRLLQRNKRVYYRPGAFISISNMAYRMKRGGDSLAMVCILLTMVLVTLCTTTCLYAGTEDAVRTRYPFDIELRQDSPDVPAYGELSSLAEDALLEMGVAPTHAIYYRSVSYAGNLDRNDNTRVGTEGDGYPDWCTFTAIPLLDYNAMMGTDYVLAPGQTLITGTLEPRLGDSLTFFDERHYDIVARDIPLPVDANPSVFGVTASLLLVVPDEADLAALRDLWANAYQRVSYHVETYYAFDTDLPAEEQPAAARALANALVSGGIDHLRVENAYENRESQLQMDASFFFLGILLSLAFMSATALSMYYKQITEGLEDQARFDIMRRVGLSRAMIRRSINGQLLAVFFSPLLASGVHLAFAFPMLTLMLRLFGLYNPRLMALTTLCTFAVIAALYAAMYAITSRVYYRIVAGLGDAA